MPQGESSLLTPGFVQRLSDPSIKTVMLCGCGGGFDFVHSLVLYPELRRLGKSIIIGSYSFPYGRMDPGMRNRFRVLPSRYSGSRELGFRSARGGRSSAS